MKRFILIAGEDCSIVRQTDDFSKLIPYADDDYSFVIDTQHETILMGDEERIIEELE